MATLTTEAVHELMLACLYPPGAVPKADAIPPDAIRVEGIVCTFIFNPVGIASKKTEIAALLAELPEQFFEDKGGGWSFLNACEDRHGNLWGQHKFMEALFSLGQAAGFVKFCAPRELWRSLPGGVPYYVISRAALGGLN